jgi:hypothetical protein
MRVLFSAALLGLAWFAALNLAASAAAWLLAPRVLRRPASDAWALALALRLLPPALSTLFVLLLFLPAHIALEPPKNEQETFGLLLVVLAACGVGVLGRSLYRTFIVGVNAACVRHALRRIPARGESDACEIEGFPGISLAGVFRTRILVGSAARRALTRAELDLAIAHERAHRVSRDNLKRCVMFCAPDFFGLSARAQRIEAHWRAGAECVADLHAVAGDERRAETLASALIKVARLRTNPGAPLAAPVWSTFHDPALLDVRVRRLLSGRPGRVRPSSTGSSIAAVTAGGIVAAWMLAAPVLVHRVTEVFVAYLP